MAETPGFRYGQARQPAASDETDALLDRFMPEYEVAGRHHIPVSAPAEITFAAATDLGLNQSAMIRAIFKTRELSFAPGRTAKLALGPYSRR